MSNEVSSQEQRSFSLGYLFVAVTASCVGMAMPWGVPFGLVVLLFVWLNFASKVLSNDVWIIAIVIFVIPFFLSGFLFH